MKTLRFVSVLLLSMVMTTAFGQRGQGQGMRNQDPEESAKQQIKVLKEIVKIDKKEEAKIKELFVKNAKERTKSIQEMRNSGSRDGMREKMQEMRKKQDEALKKILGEKRMAKYTKEMEKRRAERGAGQRRF